MTSRASPLRVVRHAVNVAVGYARFRFARQTRKTVVRSMRELVSANPMFLRNPARAAALAHPHRRVQRPTGVLGELDDASIRELARQLQCDGCCVLPFRLDDELVEQLREVAESVPSYARFVLDRPTRDNPYDADAPEATRYDYHEGDLLAHDAMLRLVVDESLAAIADAYLQTDSVQVALHMWRSLPCESGATSEAAQMFHTDRDHARFLKFFVYLTDVGPRTGPHVYVRGSQRRLPPPLRRDARLTDDEVGEHFDPDDVVELCGPAGTVVAADTSGVHKGKHPDDAQRIVIAVQFAGSRFGVRTNTIAVDPQHREVLERVRRHPWKYQRLRDAGAVDPEPRWRPVRYWAG